MTIRRVDAALAAAALCALAFTSACSSDDGSQADPPVVETDVGDDTERVDDSGDAGPGSDAEPEGPASDAGVDGSDELPDDGEGDGGSSDSGETDGGEGDGGSTDSGETDGGDDLPDGGEPPVCEQGFITEVVSIEYGERGGFGKDKMPDIVYGHPRGGGASGGGLHIVALGLGGEIVVGFDVDITDGPGPDFTVFENAFMAGSKPFAEPGEVSVSMDGVEWVTFPCDGKTEPYIGCAGKTPVYSNLDTNEISPFDPEVSGGDSFDLADIGVSRARYVRIRDVGPDNSLGSQIAAGFDLDAIAVINPICR